MTVLETRTAPGGTVPLGRALRAESVKWKRSAALRLTWAGAAFGLVNTALFVFTAQGTSWNDLLGYQNLWVVFVGPMLAALICATMAQANRKSRGGGTWYRPVQPAARRLGEWAMLAVFALVLNLWAVLIPAAVAGLLSDFTAAPWGRIFELIGVLWISQLGMLALLNRVGEHGGRLIVLGAGLAWTAIGVLFAESSLWPVIPPSWIIRGALPLTGTHANGVTLESASELSAIAPWTVALMGLLVAVPFLFVPDFKLGRGTRGTASPAAPVPPQREEFAGAPMRSQRSKARVGAAVITMLRRTPIWWLCLLAVATSAVFLRWREAPEAIELYSLMILPIGTLVLAVVMAGAAREGWRMIATRTTGTSAPALALSISGWVISGLVSAGAVAVYLLSGLTGKQAGLLLLATVVVGAMLTSFSLWLAMRAGVPVTLAVGVVGVLLGLLIGGTGMQKTLWVFVPWSWANYLTASRLLVTIPASLALTLLFTVLTVKAARKVAATS